MFLAKRAWESKTHEQELVASHDGPGDHACLDAGDGCRGDCGPDVDATATYTGRTHTVTIRGTFLCAGAIETTALNLNLIQHNGRPNITFGTASTRPLPCDDAWNPWALEVSAEDGKFTGGTINVDAFFFACDADVCARFHVNEDVKLVGR
jgi:hypothetical protein